MLFDAIKTLAKKQGISIYYLEKQNGLSNGLISKWDKSTPNAETLASVAKTLGVTTEELLEKAKQNQEV